MVKKDEYSERRRKFLAALEDGSAAILFAGVGKKMSADENYPFEVNRNFYYLTGIDQENSKLLLVKTGDETGEYLFVDEKDPNVEKWLGVRLSLDEASELSGIANVLLTSSFNGKIDSALAPEMTHFGLIDKVYLDLESELKIGPETTTRDYAKKIPLMNPSLKVKDAWPLVAGLRMIKSPEEIALMRDAIKTTDIALRNVMSTLAPGRFEYNFRNTFEYVVKEDLNAGLAFNSIFAAGRNALILHHPIPDGMVRKGDLLLCDVGARKGYYCADVSRTYPVDGRFTPLQARIYSIVLACGKAAAKFVKPGVKLADVHAFASDFMAKACVAAGLLKDVSEIRRVYYHSCSHLIGLDTHDVNVGGKETVLAPGMVISMEPGLYFKEYGIGVRIEDDLLITEKGCENLSKDILKEIRDIERMLANK